jgi:hypothetical protein
LAFTGSSRSEWATGIASSAAGASGAPVIVAADDEEAPNVSDATGVAEALLGLLGFRVLDVQETGGTW